MTMLAGIDDRYRCSERPALSAAFASPLAFSAAVAPDQAASFAGRAFNGGLCQNLPFARRKADWRQGALASIIQAPRLSA